MTLTLIFLIQSFQIVYIQHLKHFDIDLMNYYDQLVSSIAACLNLAILTEMFVFAMTKI